jgi:hypothetical protein
VLAHRVSLRSEWFEHFSSLVVVHEAAVRVAQASIHLIEAPRQIAPPSRSVPSSLPHRWRTARVVVVVRIITVISVTASAGSCRLAFSVAFKTALMGCRDRAQAFIQGGEGEYKEPCLYVF